MYKEFPVSPILQDTIESFWTYTSEEGQGTYFIQPDGCADIIFDLYSQESFVSGIMSTFQQRAVSAPSNLMGIRLRGECLGMLTKEPLYTFKNLRIEISDAIPQLEKSLGERLQTCRFTPQRLSLLEKALFELRSTAQ